MKRDQRQIATAFLAAILSFLYSAVPAQAGSATWLSSPPTNSWSNAANWTAGGPPNGVADTATFGASSKTAIYQPANIQVNGITFNSGASAYNITTEASYTFTISGTGITNQSGVTQNFHVIAAINSAAINFTNSATAGNLTTFTNRGNVNSGFAGGITSFADTSTAGSAVFTNYPGTNTNAGGGAIHFFENSTAGNSTITNKGAALGGAFGGVTPGQTEFYDNSTAGNATFTNDPGPDDGVVNTFGGGGRVTFFNTSTANTATFTNNGGTQNETGGGSVAFRDSSTAANGTFINNGASHPVALGGITEFFDTSTAANATLIANPGVGNFLTTGRILFYNQSDGGTARLKIFGNGQLEITYHDGSGVTVGSIEGDGDIFLGDKQLTVGSNNLSTSFSGGIFDFGFYSALGSLKKIGTGTFSLTSANNYSGGTFVNAGTLRASHDGALGGGNVNTASDTILILQSGATNDYISDVARLHIVTGCTVNLNYTGTPDVVGFLVVDGITQPAGLYGSAASGAPNQLPQFTGLGKLLVTTPAARSRKQHGADNAHITLPFTGPPGIECRNAGANNSYTIILTFGFPVTFANASVTGGTGTVASTTGNGTDFITLNLTGVTNVQRLAITLSGVNYGTATGNVVIRMGVLIGDTTGNGSVNASDIGLTKSQSGQAVSGSNFRTDVNVSGSINASDISLVKSKSGSALP